MAKLILLRHLKSQWNLENRFAGWTDGPLSKEGKDQAKRIAEKLSRFRIDKIYTSPLFRNQDTVSRVLELGRKYPLFLHLDVGKMRQWGNFVDLNKNHIPVFVSQALNERYYGRLQGLNKRDTMKKYGQDKVRFWRRSFDVAPPGGESLKEVVKRTAPFYKKFIEKDLRRGKNVLVVASHNSLRAIVKRVEKISNNDIINLEIPYAGLIEYQFDKFLKLKSKKSL